MQAVILRPVTIRVGNKFCNQNAYDWQAMSTFEPNRLNGLAMKDVAWNIIV